MEVIKTKPTIQLKNDPPTFHIINFLILFFLQQCIHWHYIYNCFHHSQRGKYNRLARVFLQNIKAWYTNHKSANILVKHICRMLYTPLYLIRYICSKMVQQLLQMLITVVQYSMHHGEGLCMKLYLPFHFDGHCQLQCVYIVALQYHIYFIILYIHR